MFYLTLERNRTSPNCKLFNLDHVLFDKSNKTKRTKTLIKLLKQKKQKKRQVKEVGSVQTSKYIW